MATLSRELRKTLERVVLAARGEAEAGARKALDQLAVAHHDAWPTMTVDQQGLRRRLRARGRQLGDRLEDGGKQGVERLVSECAYEQWHRMLFARFLAECELLIEPESGVSVSVGECKELARERGVDWISLASSFAQDMLPQIFRADDAVLEIALPAEHRQPLEQFLISLPTEVFLADDSLGWVYQFWQSEEKDRVNNSEKKIGADELPAVTQLFTEDYMVEFLLHNTLGAWWAGRQSPDGIAVGSEEEARAAVALPGVEWKYLRFTQDEAGRWTPAAGSFDGWPRHAREITVLDPCMGSGHFLVFALPILVGMRRVEEGLSSAAACAAVVQENLFGLEIDSRCTQISAFNLALAAWKLWGWKPLPRLNLACSGLSLNAKREDWIRLADADENARRGMERLYDLFAHAPTLGSLINPRRVGGDLLVSGFHDLQPLLEKALRHERTDEVAHQLAVTAQGVAKAAEFLARRFTLVTTNVPYLGRGKQDQALQEYCALNHPTAKTDLATCFVERCLQFCSEGGSTALVTPQGWLLLATYETLRRGLLAGAQWNCVVRLGARAFGAISGEVVNVALVELSKGHPYDQAVLAAIDVAGEPTPAAKAGALHTATVTTVAQSRQLRNPSAKVMLDESDPARLLSNVASSFQGIKTGDDERFRRVFWELPLVGKRWKFFQSTVGGTRPYGGLEGLIDWSDDGEGLARRQGLGAWGKVGVMVSQMGALPVALYMGDAFDSNASPVVPQNRDCLAALWAFCSSDFYRDEIRKVDQSLKPTNTSLVQVPFDLAHWQQVAVEKYPSGLPKPQSDDSTQWLFVGHPRNSEQPLQVAVARLLGYRWPRQTGSSVPDCLDVDSDALDPLSADDGIVCVSASKGEEPGAARLARLLATAFGAEWSAAKLDELLVNVGYAGRTLEDWLRNGFFEQHCDVFRHRPFVWHIWDGRRDGFSALVNYHKLTRANLERLTYAYLGDWLRRQQAAVLSGESGSEARLVAATQLQAELKRVLESEPPYDIFVRWKPLARQSLGWDPDYNDGVRVNIRPFVMATDVGKKGAGLLRIKPNIKWDKDRGKEPSASKDEFPWFWKWDGTTQDFAGDSGFDGNRWNDLHYSRKFKIAARKRMGLS